MGRLAFHSVADYIRVGRELAASGGAHAVTVQAVARALQVPSGSVYHRFRTRAELVAEIWLDTAEQFQAAWWTHASAPSASPGEVARFVVRWAREHRADATILLAHRQSDFLGKSIGKTLAARAKRHQLMIASQFRELAERWLNDRSQTAVTRVVFAVVDIPMAALRRALASGKPVEAKMQALVVLAADAVLSGSRVSRSRRSR